MEIGLIIIVVIIILMLGGYYLARRLGKKETELKYTEGALEGRKSDAKIDAEPAVDDPLSSMRRKADS